MIRKHLLIPARVRRTPREGFSWVDRRFVRDHASALSHDAIFLFFFLCAVSDRDGLSFWSDASISARLKLEEEALLAARDELVRGDLVAHEAPLTQVLSLPEGRPFPPRRKAAGDGSGPQLAGGILWQLAHRSRPNGEEVVS